MQTFQNSNRNPSRFSRKQNQLSRTSTQCLTQKSHHLSSSTWLSLISLITRFIELCQGSNFVFVEFNGRISTDQRVISWLPQHFSAIIRHSSNHSNNSFSSAFQNFNVRSIIKSSCAQSMSEKPKMFCFRETKKIQKVFFYFHQRKRTSFQRNEGGRVWCRTNYKSEEKNSLNSEFPFSHALWWTGNHWMPKTSSVSATRGNKIKSWRATFRFNCKTLRAKKQSGKSVLTFNIILQLIDREFPWNFGLH